VAVRSGRVLRAGYDPVLYGNYLLIHGEGERRSYFYAHMQRPGLVRRGERVYTGETIGLVGKTGNAISIGCHLHFEVHTHGRPVDPASFLRDWEASRPSG
jgi:murein DD-endopeptidase MepM/ murein hydrolase activator NlpD